MGRFQLKRGQIAIGATALVVLVAAGIAMAISNKSGGPITAVRAVESSDPESTMTDAFVDLPGAQTQPVSVAAGRTALMLVRFSAQSQCGGPGSNDTGCFVRIMLQRAGGAPRQALPAANDFAFDEDKSTVALGEREARSMDRWLVVGPGTWRARVQFRVEDTQNTFTLDDWSLILERSDRR
jgi:hypothetical protein